MCSFCANNLQFTCVYLFIQIMQPWVSETGCFKGNRRNRILVRAPQAADVINCLGWQLFVRLNAASRNCSQLKPGGLDQQIQEEIVIEAQSNSKTYVHIQLKLDLFKFIWVCSKWGFKRMMQYVYTISCLLPQQNHNDLKLAHHGETLTICHSLLPKFPFVLDEIYMFVPISKMVPYPQHRFEPKDCQLQRKVIFQGQSRVYIIWILNG